MKQLSYLNKGLKNPHKPMYMRVAWKCKIYIPIKSLSGYFRKPAFLIIIIIMLVTQSKVGWKVSGQKFKYFLCISIFIDS